MIRTAKPKQKAFGVKQDTLWTLYHFPLLGSLSLRPCRLGVERDMAVARSRTSRRYHTAATGTGTRLEDSEQLRSY